jgi:hypothetical protein
VERKSIKNEIVWLVVQTAIKNEMERKWEIDCGQTEGEGTPIYLLHAAVVAKESR